MALSQSQNDKLVVIGAGMSGLVAANVSGYKALILEASPHPNTRFGDLVGARFIHESPELRELFGYQGPTKTVRVTSDATDPAHGLEQYVRKTRECSIFDIPASERESAMNWGQGSFPYLPVDINRWAKRVEQQSGVVYNARVTRIERNGTTRLTLGEDTTLTADRVLFTIPLPTMLHIAGMDKLARQFRSLTTTVGRFRSTKRGLELGATMHYVTNPELPVTRITTKDDLVVVEASSSQTPELAQLMFEMAIEHQQRRGYDTHLDSLGLSTFGHHFVYQPTFEEDRQEAMSELRGLGLEALGRYATWNHTVKTLETYQAAIRLVRP